MGQYGVAGRCKGTPFRNTGEQVCSALLCRHLIEKVHYIKNYIKNRLTSAGRIDTMLTADRRPQTADRRPQTADRRAVPAR